MLVLVILSFFHFLVDLLVVIAGYLLKQLHTSLPRAGVPVLQPRLRHADGLAVAHAAELRDAVDCRHARQRVEVLEHARQLPQRGQVVLRGRLRQGVRGGLADDPGPVVTRGLLQLYRVLVALLCDLRKGDDGSAAHRLVPVVQPRGYPVDGLSAALRNQQRNGLDGGLADGSHLVLQQLPRGGYGLRAVVVSTLGHGVHSCAPHSPVFIFQPALHGNIYLEV
mmetsp:Transcript_53185/g.154836  ORF Transcript_53185/g.154836 Transcript_53185/m.154836 type:complete len:223 (+) Transcript_53185:176-844(+)